MPDVGLELPDAVFDAATAEAALLGFDTVEDYFRWVLDNRLALAVDGERGRDLAAYRERFEAARADGATIVSAAESAAAATDGRSYAASDGSEGTREHRIEDANVESAATALRTVEADRADVFAQRAVASTRKRLGDVGTGLDYRSSASLEGDGRPGADIAALDEIEVPGWDETLIERRRDAVGAALAFLSDAEEAKRADFVDALFAEYPAGYDSESAWWDCIKRGLEQVGRVIPATEASRTWEFRTTPGRVERISFR
jgi:hypothetical protein